MNLLQRIRLWRDFRRAKRRAIANAYWNTEEGKALRARIDLFGEIATRTGLKAEDLNNWRPELPDRV